MHATPHFFAETFEIGGSRSACVDQEIAVLLGYLSTVACQATTAAFSASDTGELVENLHADRAAGGESRLRPFSLYCVV